MAPIAASSHSRSKLKTFQYDETVDQPRLMTTDADKENAPREAEKPEQPMIPPPQPLSQKSTTRESRDCPQTPVGRLPLSELLASGEDTSRQHLNLTPVERVLWENSPMSSTSPATRRKRKRANSTSPASSSQNETSTHFTDAKPAVDLHTMQRNLKTPKADPANDLWSRYSLNKEIALRRSPTAPPGLGYTHLMHSSSPQTPASHSGRDGTGLRRALSCIEWPTSMAKRRRLNNNSSQGDITKQNGDSDSVERSKISRVSFLVEKMHDDLSKSVTLLRKDTSSETSGSSPERAPNQSPSEKSTLDYRESQIAIDSVVNELSQTAVAPKHNSPQRLVLSAKDIADLEKDAASSDFGDDDIDFDILESVDTEIEVNSVHKHRAVSVDPDGEQVDCGANCEALIKPTNLHPVPLKQDQRLSDMQSLSSRAGVTDCDEYDDGDNEVSAADLEDVFARYDSQLPRPASNEIGVKQKHSLVESEPSKTGGTNTVYRLPQAMSVEVLSDDDEFGDDAEFEHIAAECAEATQNKQVSQPQSFVCTLKPSSSSI